MKVKLARVAGFCMGVRRAMEIALEEARHAEPPVYTLGPLIHNPSALALLEKQGVKVLNEIPKKGHGTVIIRAHGAPPDVVTKLEQAGFKIKSATCPKVVKVQMLAQNYASKGHSCVLIGDKGHAEVIGILAHAGDKGILVSSEEDINSLPPLGKYIILAQTTQDRQRFDSWCQKILSKFPNGKVFNTICDATSKRQGEVRRLSKEVDAVVVVGGKKSANTKRLAEIASENNTFTVAVETVADLDLTELSKFSSVGVTAGASTPNWVINQVVKQLEAIKSPKDGFMQTIYYRFIRFLLETNLMTGIAGLCLALGATSILNLGNRIIYSSLAAGCYIYAMHTLNRLLNREAGRYNDPLRADFLSTHQKTLIGISLLSAICALSLSLYMGHEAFLLYATLSLFGGLYTARLFNSAAQKKHLNLLGTKTIFIPLAWTVVSVIAPIIDTPLIYQSFPWILAGLTIALVFLRCALLDVLEIHGDKIVGKETLAVILGEKRTTKLIKVTALLLVISSLALAITGYSPIDILSFCPPAILALVLAYKLRGEAIGLLLRLELFVELNLVFFALIVVALKIVV